MKKICNEFLIITFAISYICFGLIAYSGILFNRIMEHPIYMMLFVLGCLGPLIAAVAVHVINREALGGIKGLWDKIVKVENPKSGLIIFVLLALHYGFAVVLGVIGEFKGIAFIKYFPAMTALLASQEIGWRMIVQPRYQEYKGFWKSTIITGLLWAILFLPLIFTPNFVIYPDFFLQYSAYLVGMGMLQTTIYKQSGNILYCIIFSSLFFSLFMATGLKHSNMIFAVTAVDVAITIAYNNKVFNK